MAPLPNCFLCFSRAITYVIAQRKQLGGGAIADGETDAKNASVDGPLATFHQSFLTFSLAFQWYIQATCAVQGHGLYEGLDWLSSELSKT
jgi:hypothetical protein